MNRKEKRGRTRPGVVLALPVALACGLLWVSSALAKKPPQPPQPPGEWEVIILHPQDCYWSAAYGTSGGQQVGEACGAASLWNGTAESWVDLHPAGVDLASARRRVCPTTAGCATHAPSGRSDVKRICPSGGHNGWL